MLRRWNADRDGQQQLLGLVQERWEAAYAGPLAPHTYLHQPQVRELGLQLPLRCACLLIPRLYEP